MLVVNFYLGKDIQLNCSALLNEKDVIYWHTPGNNKSDPNVHEGNMTRIRYGYVIYCCCSATKSCLSVLQLHGLQCARLLCPWDFPGKNTGVRCHFLIQEIFPDQESNPHLLHWQVGSLPPSHQESPCIIYIYMIKTPDS